MTSRFVREIPGEYLQWVKAGVPAVTPRTPFPRRTGLVDAASSHVKRQDGAATSAEGQSLKTGTRVRHAQFGPGFVVSTSGAGSSLRAKIRFANGRVSTFMVSKTPLEIVEDKQR